MGNFKQTLETGKWLSRERVTIYPFIFILVSAAALGYTLFANSGFMRDSVPLGSDFISFWTAAKEVWAGRPETPYIALEFAETQNSYFVDAGYFAFFYPPHYLLYLSPFGAFSYYHALALWLTFGFGFYTFILSRITADFKAAALLSLAFPAAYLNITHGQNAFLSAALFAGALHYLPSRPLIAGVMFGFLTYKPQLGLLIPLVLLVSGNWRCIFAAGITTISLAAISWMLLGHDVWTAFLAQSSLAFATLEQGLVAWEKMISAYAALRTFGLPHGMALTIHIVIAVIVAALTIGIWWRKDIAYPLKASVLLCAALMVTPFGLNYDLFLLAPAFAYFFVHAQQNKFLAYEKTLIAFLFLSPLIALVFAAAGFAVMPMFLAIALCLILWRIKQYQA